MKTFMAAILVMVAFAGCQDEPGDCSAPDHPDGTTVLLETNLGNMTVRLFDDLVPTTAGNFAALAEAGTYDGVPFHRIISGFMMQGGDHTRGDGRGGAAHPDYADSRGNIPDEFHPTLCHDRAGILSMANAGANTGSSQFFITFGPTPHLDGKHTVFGVVVDGFDVLERVDEEAGSRTGTPRVPVTLVSATV